jgi:predicted amidohydrolase YtcJ
MNKKHQPLFGHCPCCNPAIDLLVQTVLSRRQFMMLGTGAFAATIALSGNSSATPLPRQSSSLIGQANATADIIYINAEVITVNDSQPTAEAVAVKDGKILAVGSEAEVLQFKSNTTQIINLNGKVMVPGFIDAHGHFFQQGVAATVANLMPPPDGSVDSIPKLQQALRDWATPTNIAGMGWIIGNGYDDSQLTEQRHPVREDLDAVSTEFPIIVMHNSGHLATVNSKALEVVGFTAATENPPGGVIRRQEGSNEPNGVLEETAFWAVLSKLGTPSPDIITIVLERASSIYASYGFTTAQEGRGSAGVFEALKQAANAGQLKLDVNAYLDYLMVPEAHQIDWPQQEYRNHLRLAGAKMNLDGSLHGKTSWLTEPYLIPPEGQPSDYKGYAAFDDDVVIERISAAYEHNFQVITHCNGDAASDQYIMAVREATQKHGQSDRRPVMIHAQMVREDQLDAMKELGIFPAFFPAHVFYYGDWHRDSVLGLERASRINPTQSTLQRGMMFSSHNDPPIVLPNAIRLMWTTVNRRTRTNQMLGEDQRVTPLEALKSVTIWAAYQLFEETSKGSIEPGKLADFTILSANPLTVNSVDIRDIEVLETIKEGQSVYQKVV